MNSLSSIVTAVTTIVVIAAVSVLTWHGDISGEAAVGIFGTVLGGGVVGVTNHVATKTGAKAALAKPGESVD